MTKSQLKPNELRTKFIGMPLECVMDVPESDFAFVRGFFTSDQRDETGDIITRSATERAIPKYRKWKNVRFMHQPRPVGKVEHIGVEDGMSWNEVEIKVIDPEAVFMVRNGLLTALSVGILININDVEMMEDGGWLINDYALAEISLVDHPANYDAYLTTIKGISQEVARVRGSQEVVTYLDTIKEELMGEQEETTDKENCACEDAIVIDQQDNQAESVLEESLELEKSPPCRQEGESKEDCVSRKIPEILDENPGMDRDQAIAIAYSMCDKSCGSQEDAVDAVQEESISDEGELIENEVIESDSLEGGETIIESIAEGEINPEAVELENTIPEVDQINVQGELTQLKHDIDLLHGLLEAVAEALHREDEQVSGEGDQAVSDELQQRVVALEAENQTLKARIEELLIPDNRDGLVKIAQAPELEEGDIEEDRPRNGDNLKFAVKRYLKGKFS